MSERELLHTDRVLVVEGKYDAARLSHLTVTRSTTPMPWSMASS